MRVNDAREQLLGFDLRISMVEPDPEWSLARRQQYLLRPELLRPLSVDCAVWRSIRSGDQRDTGLADDPDELLGEWEWNNDSTEAVLIAVTRLCTRSMGEADKPELSGEANPQELLGYDIADGGMLSGLSNCGYEDGEVEALRKQWAMQLNAHHLFEAAETAILFCAATNTRVPEHAPFDVYGLYRVTVGSQRVQ